MKNLDNINSGKKGAPEGFESAGESLEDMIGDSTRPERTSDKAGQMANDQMHQEEQEKQRNYWDAIL